MENFLFSKIVPYFFHIFKYLLNLSFIVIKIPKTCYTDMLRTLSLIDVAYLTPQNITYWNLINVKQSLGEHIESNKLNYMYMQLSYFDDQITYYWSEPTSKIQHSSYNTVYYIALGYFIIIFFFFFFFFFVNK